MGTDSPDIKSIFYEALQTNGDERAAYLESRCGQNAALRAEIESLLRSHERAGGFLPSPDLDLGANPDSGPVVEGPGTLIGRYKLLERIGEGGMAVVYMAEQQEPIRRKVALKVIKLGMDTQQVIARFEAERQALAMMDHPNIAKVLDAGATETGRPYFVMELVAGVSITEYCDKNNLSTKDRLGLFVQVCNAVQHAHQKGIIHRDIKPSNVMVTHHDGRPVPKVIDFGIAKATNQRLTEKTLFTRYAHIIGTPAYMSPEQAELSDLDIDTRSDIYSLGVLLYELLTGTTPFSEEELRKAGYIEMQRVIREQEPIKPSTKLSTLGETLTDVAKRRSSTPDLLRKAIRGDLDWIVMKSLEKDRVCRYETASGLAEDVRRHLEHEPILARGPSTLYHLQKLFRRHRGQVFAGSVMAVVAGTMIGVLSMWNRDRLQLVEAESFRHRGILSQARDQYAKADREAASAIIEPILHSRHVGPDAQLLHATILADNRRFDEAMATLNGLLGERPEVAGAAHSLWARILWENQSSKADKLKEIQEHRRQAEALLPETAEAYFLRAMTALTVKEQLTSLDKALELDPQHYESWRLRAYTYYASRKYDRLRDDALVMTILRPRDPLGHSLHAIAWRELGRYAEAVADYDHAIELAAKGGEEQIDLCSQRCEVLLRMTSYERVIEDAQEYAKLWPGKVVFQYHIFCASTALGDYDKASALFRQIIGPGQEARRQFGNRCMKYVFDALHAARPWHPADWEPMGAAFLPMIEAEETYRTLSAKGRRLIIDCGGAEWSPDGRKLVFDLGMPGYRGVAIFDPATQETDLLIVPGKDPTWSPDGRYIAIVRYCDVLRLDELVTAEREDQDRPVGDEEVWIMNADGTEPRRLARGGWPHWSEDSTQIYYHSRADQAICSIPVAGGNAEPKRILACSSSFPSLSRDKQRVAYVEGRVLKVKDLASQSLVAEWPLPFPTWGGVAWSPTNEELCMGGDGSVENMTGLWIYSLDGREPAKTLAGQITGGLRAPDGRNINVSLGTPYFEVWTADLDPSVSTLDALGPGRTADEHIWEMVAFYTRRIEADPQDAYAYYGRATRYADLHEREKASVDMRRWSAVLSRGSPSDLMLDTPASHAEFIFGEPKNLAAVNSEYADYQACISPDGLELYFSSNRPGGYGSFDIWVTKRASVQDPWGPPTNAGPEVNSGLWDAPDSMSADGLTLYFDVSSDMYTTTRATKDSPWGPRVNQATIETPYQDILQIISQDGLELFFGSRRPGGYGNGDIWVSTRKTTSDPWDLPVNLGATVNTPSKETPAWISPDGRILLFTSNRPDGFGNYDMWVTIRSSKAGTWGPPRNLGPSINTIYSDMLKAISPDGRSCYISDYLGPRPGGLGRADIWQVPIISFADFNSGQVKGKED